MPLDGVAHFCILGAGLLFEFNAPWQDVGAQQR